MSGCWSKAFREMKLVFPLAPLLAIVQASSIVTPAGNAALQASQDVTIQFVVPIDTVSLTSMKRYVV